MGNSSPLRSAIRNDDIDGVRTQLKAAGEGAPDIINEDYTGDCLCERTRNIQSPLHTSVAKRKPVIAELLLQYGADVTSGGRSGMTPLHYAAKNGDVRLCRTLVKYASDPNAEDHDGQTPVHAACASPWASSSGDDNALRYLVEEACSQGAIHHKDVDDRSPLHVAAFWGYVPLARYLLSQGADPHARSCSGKTPLDEATSRKKLAMVELLTPVSPPSANSEQ